MNIRYLLLIGFFALLSCKKEKDVLFVDPADQQESTSLTVHVMNYIGSGAFEPSEDMARINDQDTVSISQLAYYISNVTLIDANNVPVKANNSYHLISQSEFREDKLKFTIKGLPSGNYKSIRFNIGVDSLRNFSIDNVGDLDPNNFMAWDWNIGYKFFLIEGFYYPNPSNPSVRSGFVVHVGELDNLKEVTLDFFQASLPDLTLSEWSNSNVYLRFDLRQAFAQIDLSAGSSSMGGPLAVATANGYASAFSLSGVSNP